jgi:hypothetical protein
MLPARKANLLVGPLRVKGGLRDRAGTTTGVLQIAERFVPETDLPLGFQNLAATKP